MKFHYKMNPFERVPKVDSRMPPCIFVFWDFFGKTLAPRVSTEHL